MNCNVTECVRYNTDTYNNCETRVNLENCPLFIQFATLTAELARYKGALEMACEALCITNCKYEYECLACPVSGDDIKNSTHGKCYMLLIDHFLAGSPKEETHEISD